MKKLVLSVMCLCLISLPVMAQEYNSYGVMTDNIQQPKKPLPEVDDQSQDNYTNSDDFNPVTDAYYGSDASPAFNHTYGENTHESDYGYGSF